MKTIKIFLFTITTVLGGVANAQDVAPKGAYKIRRALIPASCAFVSGAAWGTHEATAHHWGLVHERFPTLNPRWWNPADSWKNKYINGDPEQGRRRIPVQLTDAKHLFASINQVGMFASGLFITLGERRKWWHYGLDILITAGAYSAGNNLTYNVVFK